MQVVHFLPYDDVGGVGYRSATALERYQPSWKVTAYAGAPSYLQFPQHSPWDWSRIMRDWRDADIRHTHDHRPNYQGIPANVVTYHGTGFRENPQQLLDHAGDAKVLVSTLDLWLQAPDHTTWIPQMDDPALIGHRKPQGGPLRIAHAPTNRALKSTHEFLQAAETLAHYYPIEVVLIEGKIWQEALTIKGTCDVLFDQTAYGYGGNSVEAWHMGIPTICGAPDQVIEEYERRFGYLPFYYTRADTILEALADMLDPDTRTAYGKLGLEHAHKWHSYEAGAEALTDIYES